MKKWFIAGSLALFVVAVSCKKDEDNSNQVNATDQTFMANTAISNMAEIQLGQLAATKGTNTAVKSFGQMMATEHTQAQTDLQSVASNTGTTLPTTLDPTHQQLQTTLSSMPAGRAWDSTYIRSQVTDHQATLANFQTELNSGQHTQVRNNASTYMPHIQMHLTTADSISRKL